MVVSKLPSSSMVAVITLASAEFFFGTVDSLLRINRKTDLRDRAIMTLAKVTLAKQEISIKSLGRRYESQAEGTRPRRQWFVINFGN